MSEVIAEYNKSFPGIDIELREGFADDVREDVRGGIADFGIGYLDDLPASHTNPLMRIHEAGSTVHALFEPVSIEGRPMW